MSNMLPKYGNELDQTLLVLHAINELGGCTAQQIIDFTLTNDIVPFLELQLALQSLVSSGNASRIAHPADHLYIITEAGRETLALFLKRARSSVAEKITCLAAQWRERFRAEREVATRIDFRATGDAVLDMQIVENNQTVMSLNLVLPNPFIAQRCADQFKANATELYQSIMQILSRGNAS